MASPFSMLNIAHLAAGFNSQTHVSCKVNVKAARLLPSYSFIRRSPEYSLPKHRTATPGSEPLPKSGKMDNLYSSRGGIMTALFVTPESTPIFTLDLNGMCMK